MNQLTDEQKGRIGAVVLSVAKEIARSCHDEYYDLYALQDFLGDIDAWEDGLRIEKEQYTIEQLIGV